MIRRQPFTPVNPESKQENVTAICFNKQGRVVAVGKNSYVKTHPIQAKFAAKVGKLHHQFLHAEIDGLIRAREPVYRMKIIRVGASGRFLPSKPCLICQSAIESYGVKVVEYLTSDGDRK